MPRLSVEVPALRPNRRRLDKYRVVCGFPDGVLPVTFPQVMALGLQVHLMTRREFPLPILGAVHVRNIIREIRPLDSTIDYRVQAEVLDARPVASGNEFAVATRYYDRLGLVWESVATALHRRKDRGRSPARTGAAPSPLEGLSECATFDVTTDIGRRYGRISGDLNPIHLCWLGGRLFGFPRHIAHGMWSLARCVAQLGDALPAPPFEIAVDFKQAVLLPSRVSVLRSHGDDPLSFALISHDRSRLHLLGSIRPYLPSPEAAMTNASNASIG